MASSKPRVCMDCPRDISDLAPQAKRCKLCAEARKKKGTKSWKDAKRESSPPKPCENCGSPIEDRPRQSKYCNRCKWMFRDQDDSEQQPETFDSVADAKYGEVAALKVFRCWCGCGAEIPNHWNSHQARLYMIDGEMRILQPRCRGNV